MHHILTEKLHLYTLYFFAANIIIGTPGRLEALFDKGINGLAELARCVKSLEMLVLDEADQLLDMGFEASINTILSYLPKQRRTGLFSATQTGKYIFFFSMLLDLTSSIVCYFSSKAISRLVIINTE